ncbi:MAG: tripartite tricarboxylate transporter substrate binding protein [Xanthobacteraceae bacterium]
MITRRRLTLLAASAFAPMLLAGPVRAQTWPNRFVRLIVPYPAGGGADAIARILGAKLSEMWGQQVLIENKGGAGGNIASDAAAKSPPDGYTMYLGAEFLSTNPHVYPKLSYDPIADLTPVSAVVQYPTIVAVPKDSPAKTVQEFISQAKSNPGRTFGTPGHGTGPHLAGEMFKRAAGIELTHIPYRGAAPGLNDLVGGRIDSFFNNIAPVVPLMNNGQVRGLAVTTAKRSAAAPDVPTIAESGLAGYDVPGWYAIFVPAKSPPEVIARMNADINTALTDRAVKEKLEALGLFVGGSTPDTLGSYLKAETEKWGPIIKAAGITIKD